MNSVRNPVLPDEMHVTYAARTKAAVSRNLPLTGGSQSASPTAAPRRRLPCRESDQAAFDPSFDDAEWSDGWLRVPIVLVPPTVHPSGYRVVRRVLHRAEVFGRPYRLDPPSESRLLLGPNGRLWMSSTPQEQMMMYNNGCRSRGHVLVGGLGLGLYPQYAATGAAGEATRFTVVERSPAVRAIAEPTLRGALDVPLEVTTGDVEVLLSGPVTARYDTIFLDIWDTVDAARLPAINRLRGLALRHLAPGGTVLIWGYRWMVRLFEQACRQLLAVRPSQRNSWVVAQTSTSPQAAVLLGPVAERFGGMVIDDVESALDWCRSYATT